MPSARKLSSLEQTVLGLCWLRGPCTTYAVMKELSLSESSFHKSRAGTAYSVTRRLVAGGFLAASETGSARQDHLLSLTPKGEAALRDWISPPVDLAEVAHSADMLRLRFFFLGIINREQRLAFIDDAIAKLEEFRLRCEALLPKNEELGDYFGVLATASTILETRARVAWLMMVRSWVEDETRPPGTWAEDMRTLCANWPIP